MKLIHIPISIGELIDKISILEIKVERLKGIAKNNANNELDFLYKVLAKENIQLDNSYLDKLRDVNLELWEIEDQLRTLEKLKHFNEEFISLARSVYIKNDLRASIKRTINIHYDSAVIEEKSYSQYN